MIKRLLQPHSIIITAIIFLFIWLLNFLQLNMHYLDPFNNGIKDYEITDIVYAYLSNDPYFFEDQIVLINTDQPNRTKIAQLIQKLDSAQAKVIGIDILFTKFHKTQEDTLLKQALEKNNKVVLACELRNFNKSNKEFQRIVGVDSFFSANANLGYVNFPANETKTIRMFSPSENVNGQKVNAFATAITQVYAPNEAKTLLKRNRSIERINYITSDSLFIFLEQERALNNMSVEQLTRSVKNKVVLVGYVPKDNWNNPIKDRHYTPLNKNYGGKSVPDMYGLVIHANVISMILRKNYVIEFPEWVTTVLAIIFCYFNVLLIHWMYNHFHQAFHGITRALQLVEFLFLFLFIAALFYLFRLRLEFSLGILALLLAYDIIMIYESLIREKFPILNRIPDQFNWKKKNGKTEKNENPPNDPPVQDVDNESIKD